MSGVLASEVTSLGCHTDLWNPSAGVFSSLVDKLNIRQKLPPIKPAGAALGPVLPAIAAAVGLSENVLVFCGIHDSNASLLPYVLAFTPPFSVVSTGTWTIAMSIGGEEKPLDPDRDTLINVNALGQPVRSARFMGGREFDLMTGGIVGDLDSAATQETLSSHVMLLPAVLPDTGPFQGSNSRWVGAEPPAASEARAIATAFYLALVTAECLLLTGHVGQIVVEGPFAKNQPYLAMLAAATGSEVRLAASQTGTSIGAALLVTGDPGVVDTTPLAITNDLLSRLSAYAVIWREAVMGSDPQRG